MVGPGFIGALIFSPWRAGKAHRNSRYEVREEVAEWLKALRS
jgi:hypothetical protein